MNFVAAARLLFLFLLILVTWLTLTPDPENTEAGFAVTRWIALHLFGDGSLADKIAHFAAYGVLGAAAALGRLRVAGKAVFAILLLALYGAGLEALQGLGGVRDPDPMDALANSLGALAGYPAISLLLAVTARKTAS